MCEALRLRLVDHYGLDERLVALAGSGTAAITALLLAAAGRARPERPLCLCPSFTFVATAAAAQACGYTPWFVDIDPESWALDPLQLECLQGIDRVGAVLVVAPFGRMVDLHAWDSFSGRTGLPVVVDAAACFDTLDPVALRGTRIPVAVSLHATKTLSTAEGGIMLCGDAGLVGRAAAAVNFGFVDARVSMVPGFNGKLSEYHAIVGLADLDGWARKRAGFLGTAAAYATAAREIGLADRILVNTTRATPYAHFIARSEAEAGKVTQALEAQGIEWRRWYGNGLAGQPAFSDCPAKPLPVTGDVASRVLGLPFSEDLDRMTVVRILQAIAGVSGIPDRCGGQG